MERISLSSYKSKFILKGGMLIVSMVGIDTRTTMDLDATIKGQKLAEQELRAIMEDIIHIPVDDGVIFILKSIEEIREEADYPRFWVSIEALFDKTRQMLKVDITTRSLSLPAR